MKLVVTHAFGPYQVGDEIIDTDEIALADGEHPGRVVKVASDAPAAPVAVDDHHD